ncbi:hypothetical protein HPP92_009568 [Vanilla planifolia]|uniref:Uncharacterized protein n=1 Tax=Vanilla planifolia TaxID=51239 RepID=A0A835RJJ6_VANPL|nr:hypothetical protein HPP92_009568 [Vanilla planifolia]
MRVVGGGDGGSVLQKSGGHVDGPRRLSTLPHVCHALGGRPQVPQVQEQRASRFPPRRREQEEESEQLRMGYACLVLFLSFFAAPMIPVLVLLLVSLLLSFSNRIGSLRLSFLL